MPVQHVRPSAARLREAARRHGAVRPRSDADSMALCLFTLWAVRTGRRLPRPPFTELGHRELAEFWVDDRLD